MKKIGEQPDKSSDFVNVSILVAATLCIGLYLILTAPVIAKDGVTFIKYAQRLDIVSGETMVREFQHPGYPRLILAAHKTAGVLFENSSIMRWVYCGQSVTLLFRLLTIAVLYFTGKQLLGAPMSFWGVLILILLPKPAEYGSDALSDWPHLFFLALGFLLLLKGAEKKRWWVFGFASLAAGAGYLIRPECAQLVVLGGMWLGLQLVWPKHGMGRVRALLALVLMLVGFMAAAGPYMHLKGAVFPKKNVGQFSRSTQEVKHKAETAAAESKVRAVSIFTPSKIAKSIGKLFGNVSETLMWFFVPGLLIGMYKKFKVRKWYEPEMFFVVAIIALNVPVMIWLYCRHGYISGRHTLPLLIVPILYVPVGLKQLAKWCPSRSVESSERFWFVVLVVIGVCICAPKLFRPIHSEKQGYRQAARWLKANTDNAAIIAVPDKRISFYAERKEYVYNNDNIPNNADYIVKIFNKRQEAHSLIDPLCKLEYEFIDERGKRINTEVYKRLGR